MGKTKNMHRWEGESPMGLPWDYRGAFYGTARGTSHGSSMGLPAGLPWDWPWDCYGKVIRYQVFRLPEFRK